MYVYLLQGNLTYLGSFDIFRASLVSASLVNSSYEVFINNATTTTNNNDNTDNSDDDNNVYTTIDNDIKSRRRPHLSRQLRRRLPRPEDGRPRTASRAIYSISIL